MATKLKALEQKMEELQAQIKKEGQEAFNEAIKELFDKNPTIEAFRWTQYTPYFNDGDTCTFGVNTDVKLKVFGEEGFFDRWDRRSGKELEGEPYSDFASCLYLDDLMLSLFGDHVEVTCYRDRIEVEEYQHD